MVYRNCAQPCISTGKKGLKCTGKEKFNWHYKLNKGYAFTSFPTLLMRVNDNARTFLIIMLENRSVLAQVPEGCFLDKCMVQIEDSISESEYFWFDVAYWMCAAVIVIVGIPVNYGLVHYERFGGDPQKRSLNNRMISSSVVCNIMAGYSMHTFTAMLRCTCSEGLSFCFISK